jgi:hypothetical protein
VTGDPTRAELASTFTLAANRGLGDGIAWVDVGAESVGPTAAVGSPIEAFEAPNRVEKTTASSSVATRKWRTTRRWGDAGFFARIWLFVADDSVRAGSLGMAAPIRVDIRAFLRKQS